MIFIAALRMFIADRKQTEGVTAGSFDDGYQLALGALEAFIDYAERQRAEQ